MRGLFSAWVGTVVFDRVKTEGWESFAARKGAEKLEEANGLMHRH